MMHSGSIELVQNQSTMSTVLKPDLFSTKYQFQVNVTNLKVSLSADKPWAERKTAAQKLGQIGSPESLRLLLEALPNDPFWMVRCTIIEAVERIDDARALPTLREVALSDEFQVVRAYAKKALDRLSK